MVVRVRGGVITDQMLTGSLRYFEIAKTGIGANAIGDGNYRANSVSDIPAGGSGYSVDLGFTAARNDIEFGLVFRNLLSNINWNKNIKRTDYNFHFDNLTAENASDDTIWVSDEYEVQINDFSTRPPLELEIGAAKYFGSLLTSISMSQGFENSAIVSKTPRLATGIEYKPLGWLALRTGTAIGGIEKLALSVG